MHFQNDQENQDNSVRPMSPINRRGRRQPIVRGSHVLSQTNVKLTSHKLSGEKYPATFVVKNSDLFQEILNYFNLWALKGKGRCGSSPNLSPRFRD